MNNKSKLHNKWSFPNAGDLSDVIWRYDTCQGLTCDHFLKYNVWICITPTEIYSCLHNDWVSVSIWLSNPFQQITQNWTQTN